MNAHSKSSTVDTTQPCIKCGGGTYTLPGGSIWCPDEDAHPGGYFTKRVAFERPPGREPSARLHPLPKRETRAPAERRASAPTSKPVTVKPKADDGWGIDTHDFVETER